MNERIEELALQVYGSAATAQEIKFAELIVRECLALNKQVCLELHEDDQGLAGYKTMMNLYKVSLRNKIEEHFGVEE